VQENQTKIQAQLERESSEIIHRDASERDRVASQKKAKGLLDVFHGLPESEQIIIR
jgi:hypothetical protein